MSAPALVLETYKSAKDSGDYFTKTYNITSPTAGNMLVLLWSGVTHPAISSITDNVSSTWVKAIADTGTYVAEIWYTLNVSASISSITVTTTGGSSEACNFFEISRSGGTSGATVESGTTGANESTQSALVIRSGAITPSTGRVAAMFACWGRTGSASYVSGPTGGFTAYSSGNHQRNGGYQFVASTSGSYEYTVEYTNQYATSTAVIAAISWPATADGGRSRIINVNRAVQRAASW